MVIEAVSKKEKVAKPKNFPKLMKHKKESSIVLFLKEGIEDNRKIGEGIVLAGARYGFEIGYYSNWYLEYFEDYDGVVEVRLENEPTEYK